MLKSALTSALAGGPAPVPTLAPKKGTLDPNAFPCLPYADELDGVADVTQDLQDLSFQDLRQTFAIVGSAPTNLLKPDGTSFVSGCALRMNPALSAHPAQAYREAC